MTMLIDKLKKFEYYKNLIPLYLQNSYGFLEQFETVFEILLECDKTVDEVLSCFNVLMTNYFVTNNIDENSYECDILDKIGELYGVRRAFNITNEDGTHNLYLNNSEFLKLIKARIIQNHYDGTYENSRKVYDMMELPVYIVNDSSTASALVIIDESTQLTDNEKIMFTSGLFTLKSMGITYSHEIIKTESLFIFDTTDSNRYWDKGVWL